MSSGNRRVDNFVACSLFLPNCTFISNNATTQSIIVLTTYNLPKKLKTYRIIVAQACHFLSKTKIESD
jgi:hypothetical protein